MQNVKTKIIMCRIGIILCFAFIAAVIILGYIVAGENRHGEMCDGFGRLLDKIPDALGTVFPQWAGIVWFMLDCAGIAVSIIVIDRLFRIIKIYKTNEEEDWIT